MNKKQNAKSYLIIAVAMFTITAIFFTTIYVRTKKNIENFNATLGKDEKVSFSQVVQAIQNDNKFGTTEEQIRFAALEPKKGIIEIREKMFLAQVNDVYLNSDDYMGKTIKLEGIFKTEQYYDDTEPYCFVLRYGPGCCGSDGNAGFEVKWDKDRKQTYPAAESWVEASGILKTYEEDGCYQYLYLDLSSLNLLSKRGAETVFQ
jgi:uncharacterized membrane protein YcgQ (UPF0703/DUF1980 family)